VIGFSISWKGWTHPPFDNAARMDGAVHPFGSRCVWRDSLCWDVGNLFTLRCCCSWTIAWTCQPPPTHGHHFMYAWLACCEGTRPHGHLAFAGMRPCMSSRIHTRTLWLWTCLLMPLASQTWGMNLATQPACNHVSSSKPTMKKKSIVSHSIVRVMHLTSTSAVIAGMKHNFRRLKRLGSVDREGLLDSAAGIFCSKS